MYFLIGLGITFVLLLVGGGIAYNTTEIVVEPPPREDCTDCVRVQKWWDSLNWWGKMWGWAWYGVMKAGCAIKGC